MRSRVLQIVLVAFVVLGIAAAVPARAQCDTAPPTLTGFTFTPSAIDTTLAAQIVTCNMTLADSPAGVASATCAFTSPDSLHRQSCTVAAPSSGTPQSGTYSCGISFPRYSPAGTWTASVTTSDAVGNNANINPATLGFSSTLSVTSDPDTAAPTLQGFGLSPGAVDVSSASQNVTCSMTLADAKSGVSFASCQLTSPSTSQTQSCASNTPSSGNRNNGTFSCVVTIPRYAEAGTWTPQVIAVDAAGNFPSPPITPSTTLTVTANPDDLTAPSLTSFDFNPKSVSTGGGPRSVTCTLGVADSPAGVSAATCTFSITTFVPPSTIVTQSHACTATTPSSGTPTNGTYQCTVVLPQYSASGMWTSSASLSDADGNSASYPQALFLNVDCGAGDAETTCRFSDHQTLTWDAVTGATQYNVYRGNVSGLTDANNDHLPDGGYGTCQDSRDPNLTDTTFTDTDVPTAGQIGFFYLVDYKSGGVEKGLGYNSYGQARTVAVPCP